MSNWGNEHQRAFRRQKSRLTRAENAKDWRGVIRAADEFEAYWDAQGMSVPDDWARWQRAKDDAERYGRLTK